MGPEMGGPESRQHDRRDYRKQIKELKCVAAGAAQGLNTLVHDSCS
jgi:hypothetical protein